MFEQDEAPLVGPGQKAGAEALDAFFARTPRLAVAFSGGCDSSYLVAAARQAGVDVRAYLVRTFHHRRDVGDGTGGVAHMGDGHDLCAFGDHLVRSVGKDATFTVQIEPFQCRSGTHGKLLERQ